MMRAESGGYYIEHLNACFTLWNYLSIFNNITRNFDRLIVGNR